MIELTSSDQRRLSGFQENPCPFQSKYFNALAWGIVNLRNHIERGGPGNFDNKLLLAKLIYLYPADAVFYTPIVPRLESHSTFISLWLKAREIYSSSRARMIANPSNMKLMCMVHIGSIANGMTYSASVPTTIMRELLKASQEIDADTGRKVHCTTCYVMKPINKECGICGFTPKPKEKPPKSAWEVEVQEEIPSPPTPSWATSASSTTWTAGSSERRAEWRDSMEDAMNEMRRLRRERGE